MVYLFGGAFLLGASNDVAILGDSLYDGKEMADRGDVIIVTINYRVGTMGFLSSGDARLPGLTSTLILAPFTLPFECRDPAPKYFAAAMIGPRLRTETFPQKTAFLPVSE